MTPVAGFVEKFSRRVKGAIKTLLGDGFERCPEPIEGDGLRAQCLEAFPQDPATLASWDRLVDAAPAATTFHRPVWQRAVVQRFCKPDRLRLIMVWRGPDLVGVLPLSIRDDGLLESVGASVSDYLEPLVTTQDETAVWRAMFKVLSALRSAERSTITLHNIRDDSACRTALAQIAPGEGFDVEERALEPTPVLALPKTWDEYLATFDAHERKETRRKINKAITRGNGQLVRCGNDPQEIASTLACTLSLMEQAQGPKAEDVKRTLHPFLELAAPTLIGAGHLIVTTLLIEEKPAAVILQFPHSTGPQLYNCGFDAAQREWSPGVVLTTLSIQQAIESGATQYDLLRGQEPYKYRLGAKDRPLWMVNLRKR